jgi:hypothetical protein
MNINFNHFLARNPHTLEVFCDYLEENATTICDQNLYLFLRARQHEERGFCESSRRPSMNGDGNSFCYGNGFGDGNDYFSGYGDGHGDGYGCGYGNGNGRRHGFSDGNGRGVGDERNL